MSQRREVEARLALYDELSGILGAMRSYALAELRKISKRELAQQDVVHTLSLALNDLASVLFSQSEQEDTDIGDIWLLFGTVRGFCGGFNEDVVRFWKAETDEHGPLILIGERLHDMVADRTHLYRIRGADSGLDALSAIDRILIAVTELRNATQQPLGLIACIRDEQGARSQRLWPLPCTTEGNANNPPFTYQAAEAVGAGVAEHFLFHSLLALMLRSIRVENHMRLIQMETALRYLERSGDELRRQRNRMRQEEIVEEIELMVGRR